MLQDQPTMAPQTEKPNRKLPQHYLANENAFSFLNQKYNSENNFGQFIQKSIFSLA